MYEWQKATSYNQANRKHIFFRHKFDGVWSDWDKITTISDLPNLYYRIEDTQNAGNPTEAIKNKWATMPDGNYICEICVGSVHAALVQKIKNGNYGSVYIISYDLATPLYIRKVLESWIVK